MADENGWTAEQLQRAVDRALQAKEVERRLRAVEEMQSKTNGWTPERLQRAVDEAFEARALDGRVADVEKAQQAQAEELKVLRRTSRSGSTITALIVALSVSVAAIAVLFVLVLVSK